MQLHQKQLPSRIGPGSRKVVQHRSAIACRCSADASTGESRKQKVVFLGTPEVAAIVLRELIAASKQSDAAFEVAAVVSQPGKPRGRGNKSTPLPTPVEEEALRSGIGPSQILCPASAKDPAFLEALQALAPDLCITAAYGNMLPQRFLDIPRLGTLNVHPSLLPKFRGAAPVQRALIEGVEVTGVSVAYTVLRCDAGPVLAQEKVPVDPDIQAPDLLALLFKRGAALLLDHLPCVWAGTAAPVAQEEAGATHAPKLQKEEAVLDFRGRSASELHNAVRGMAGWPGSVGHFILEDPTSGATEPLELKVIRTQAPAPRDVEEYTAQALAQPGVQVGWAAGDSSGDMLVPCSWPEAKGAGPGSVLRVSMVQPPTKKAMRAKDFRNGVRQKKLLITVK